MGGFCGCRRNCHRSLRPDRETFQRALFPSEGCLGFQDQTYALYGLTQEQLARTQMPVGEFTKEEIRGHGEDGGNSCR